MKKWLALLSGFALCAAAIAAAVIWDNSISPPSTIPEPRSGKPSSHALPGINRLIAQAKLRDSRLEPRYRIPMVNTETERFRDWILRLGPRLGWLTHRGDRYSDIQATIPEGDLPEFERMVQDPHAWLQKAREREPAGQVKPGPLVNVSLDLDPYHGSSHWPLAPYGAGIAGLVALVITAAATTIPPAEEHWQ